MTKLRVIADVNACCGYGSCKEICPEIFQLGQGGLVTLVSDIIPKGLEGKAAEACELCPQMAISLETIDD
jgi:ferredoxin